MKVTLAVAILTGFLASNAGFFHAQQRLKEQRGFGAEEQHFRRPFALPHSILDILSREDMVKGALEDKDVAPEQLPASWFQASVVHLAVPAEEDIVVKGVCPVCGANVAPFWVFRPAGTGYEKILFAGGLGLQVKQHRTNGYLDIETGLVAQQKPWTGVWRRLGLPSGTELGAPRVWLGIGL
jgi:hypothetical protein